MDGTQEQVRLVTEYVRITIRPKDALVESRYVFKNLSDEEVTLVMFHPLFAIHTNVGFGRNDLGSFQWTWDKEPVVFETAPTAGGINADATTYQKRYRAELTLNPNATHVARFRYTASLGRRDGRRFTASATGGGRSWAGQIERADYSFKYDSESVFSVFGFLPEWRWQWGAAGAYYKRLNFVPAADERVFFDFYSPDF